MRSQPSLQWEGGVFMETWINPQIFKHLEDYLDSKVFEVHPLLVRIQFFNKQDLFQRQHCSSNAPPSVNSLPYISAVFHLLCISLTILQTRTCHLPLFLATVFLPHIFSSNTIAMPPSTGPCASALPPRLHQCAAHRQLTPPKKTNW